jgi:hypothetical protein
MFIETNEKLLYEKQEKINLVTLSLYSSIQFVFSFYETKTYYQIFIF